MDRKPSLDMDLNATFPSSIQTILDVGGGVTERKEDVGGDLTIVISCLSPLMMGLELDFQ